MARCGTSALRIQDLTGRRPAGSFVGIDWMVTGRKVLVIGVGGTGKSYLVEKMKQSRLNAVDVDDGFATFVNSAGIETEYDQDGGANWWRSHYYILKPGRLERLLSRNERVYLFGDVGGQPGKKNG